MCISVIVAEHLSSSHVYLTACTASESNPRNEHLQVVVDAFTTVYKEDQAKCNERGGGAANSFASGFANGKRMLSDVEHLFGNSTILESDNEEGGPLRSRRLAMKWHPFHPDIQKVRASCIATHFIL